MNAGNKPTKHPGQAPPNRLVKVAKSGAIPFDALIERKSRIFSIEIIKVKETSVGIINKLSDIKEIEYHNLNDEKRFGSVTLILFIIISSNIYPAKNKINCIYFVFTVSMSFLILYHWYCSVSDCCL